jgi:hypothetical protein
VTTLVGQPGMAGVQLGPTPPASILPGGLSMLPGGELVIADTAENAVLILR